MRRLGSEFEPEYPDYFCWLCELVCVDGRYTDEAYWVLAKALWDTDYFWVLDMDSDRAKDGIALRYQYEKADGTYNYDGPATVLEVLIALAQRMDDILDELDGEDRLPMYFWEMIDNLGLGNFSDRVFEDNPDKTRQYNTRINRRLEQWMERDIDYDGTGSPFPLSNPRQDQRDTDLWYQVNAYMMERYC